MKRHYIVSIMQIDANFKYKNNVVLTYIYI